MAKDPVCGAEVDEEQIRQQTGTTAYGAKEVDPTAGTRRFHDGKVMLGEPVVLPA